MKRRIQYKALDSKVLVVAKEGHAGDWAAYIGAVPGYSHDAEWREVASDGSKLPESVARILFPAFEDLVYRS
ncbi:unnamed protein product [marine sediment metagenome]|uniref:Uncharacterized protein n=1 Tax=marine sediment metagenome TaxID=412755 RepID=X1AI30_9ZZZZ